MWWKEIDRQIDALNKPPPIEHEVAEAAAAAAGEAVEAAAEAVVVPRR
jgi:hypothetical protein